MKKAVLSCFFRNSKILRAKKKGRFYGATSRLSRNKPNQVHISDPKAEKVLKLH